MPQKLSREDFLKSFKLAPRLAIELLFENQKSELLLLKRDKEPFTGMWHLPGGFLLKDESINDCIIRLAKDELNLVINPKQTKRLGLFETLNGDPRGHILHHPVKVKIPSIVNKDYFRVIPKNTIPYQSSFLEKLGYKLEK